MYWPNSKDVPIKLEQLTVTLLKEEKVEEGILNMAEFEVDIQGMASALDLLIYTIHIRTGVGCVHYGVLFF